MGNIIKEPYEISLWEDILNKDETDLEGYNAYYKEKKICIIGSDTMDTPIRAFNPILTENINGNNTLTFSVFYRYYDENTGEFLENPFIKLLVNERKVKLHYKSKWYDFIIKGIDESSEGEVFSYTAKDIFINELSKSGFNIELDSELENNQGTAVELAEKALEGSDWKVTDSGEIFQEKREEPLYAVTLKNSITAKNMEDSSDTISLAAGTVIYTFYSCIVNRTKYFQFLYRLDGKYEIDEDNIIINSPNYFIDNVTYTENTSTGLYYPSFASGMYISEIYRGERIVRSAKSTYDPTINKYVNVYKDSAGNRVYGYTELEYLTSSVVVNYLVNSSGFTSTSGWNCETTTIENVVYPPLNKNVNIKDTIFTSLLKMDFSKGGKIYNSAIVDNKSSIGEFAKDEKYVFRIKYHGYGQSSNIPSASGGIKARVCKYTLSNGVYTLGEDYFDFYSSSKIQESSGTTQYIIASCKKGLSYKDLVAGGIGFFLTSNTKSIYYVEEIEFFPYITDKDGKMTLPGEIPTATVKTKYYYYYPNSNAESVDDIVFIYKGDSPSNVYDADYDSSFQKIRSIQVSESNRFNIIQSICETFECWAKFTIEHNEDTGEILLDEGHRQKKWVSFHNYVGKENERGFRYGINLNSIQRNIDSEAIVTKIIVKNNSNEFATDGFCSIARAYDNPTKENFSLNFDYYIKQGLLNSNEVTNDLYSSGVGNYIGYYTKLRQINDERDALIEELSALSTAITKLNSQSTTYFSAWQTSEEEYLRKVELLYQYKGIRYENINSNSSILDDDKVKEIVASIKTAQSSSEKNRVLYEQAEFALIDANERQEEISTILEEKVTEKEALNSEFYKKYSRFMQEGSWISEDYYDDDLYFLDSENVLATSAYPKVSYVINVLEISQVEGYENYIFELGDKTYIEDTEFFGWVMINGVKTPYKEEIIISEISTSLDSPDENRITVQNYKTQFEDLFQRIAAATQSVEYQSGNYARAASAVTTEGAITTYALQAGLSQSAWQLQNVNDQSVRWDETGITTSSITKPNELLRLISGGLFVSDDGGTTWGTSITGKGINANFITTGQINTSVITILNGSVPSFRWDENGINAFAFSRNSITNEPESFNLGQFVRFDQYGLYGIKGQEYTFIPTSEEEIREKSDFALTWTGFQIKSNHNETGDSGYIRISSEEDFQVIDGNSIERVKIGLINPGQYGLRFSDIDGNTVLESNDNGQLWLKDKLMVGPNIYNPRTILGVVETYESEDGDYSKIFQVKDIAGEETLAFYDNGKLEAKNAYIEGEIHATSGSIGNLTVQSLQVIPEQLEKIKSISIKSDTGFIFKTSEGVTTPQTMVLRCELSGYVKSSSNSYEWYGSSDLENWGNTISTSETLTLNYSDLENLFNSGGVYYVKVNFKENSSSAVKTTYETINSVTDGRRYELDIISSQGDIFKEGEINTTLIAVLYDYGVESTNKYNSNRFKWTRVSDDTAADQIWNDEHYQGAYSIEITNADVNNRATFFCDFVEETTGRSLL